MSCFSNPFIENWIYYTDYFFFIKIDDLFYMVTTLSHMASYLAACKASPVKIWLFGRLRRKTNTRRREDTKVWYWETMFSQVFSFDFSLHGPLHKYFLYLAPMGLHTNTHVVHIIEH